MSKLGLFALVLVLGLVVAGGVFLMTWEIPPPLRQIETVVPDERFPR